MAALLNFHLEWRAFRELVRLRDRDNWIGGHVVKAEDGAQRFSRFGVARSRADKSAKAPPLPASLAPAHLELPVLTFVTRHDGPRGLGAISGNPQQFAVPGAERMVTASGKRALVRAVVCRVCSTG